MTGTTVERPEAAGSERGHESTQTFKAAKQRYRLQRQLSASPTSNVWRARDTVTGNDVVLKRLVRGSIDDPIARRRLEDEASAGRLVSHPSALPILDEMFEKGEAAIVFPYVQGETLAERLRGGKMHARAAAQVALDIADVLAAAHEAGVAHRDVKPSNILLGDDGRTRLLDFGIARALGEPADEDRSAVDIEMTGSGMAIGTLPYMAPEQLTGGRPSGAADVYAFGVVTYEMLTGQRPYAGGSPAEQLELQQEPPSELTGPPALVALVLSALDPVPEHRPTAAQLGRSLRGWLDGRLETDAATTAVPIVEPAPRPAPARTPLAGMAAVLLGGVVIGAMTLYAFGGVAEILADASTAGPEAGATSDQPTMTLPLTPPARVAETTAVRPAALIPSDGRSDQVAPTATKDKHDPGHHHHRHRKH